MRRFLTVGWLLRHVIAIVLVVAFLGLGWWQAERAGAGNLSSYAYAVEWPVFAGFVVFMWIREVRLALRGGPAALAAEEDTPTPEPAPTPEPVPAPSAVPATVAAPAAGADAGDDDDELASYNRMLAWLNANPGRRFTDYPG